MNMDLSGRVALVPGGSGGIGSHVAEVLAECGADVVVGYHFNAKRAEEIVTRANRLGRRARADRIDATDYDSVSRWVERSWTRSAVNPGSPGTS
jgi:NAD(P)-dependent dehydrogenase (short-subunit alcohol dehydrogenase family)